MQNPPRTTPRFTCGERIGAGAYGVVFHARWGQQICAAKRFHLSLTTMQEATIQTEIKFLKRLRHKHIIQFYHDHEQDGRLYLIMDLAEMGSLANQIVNSKLDWPTKTRLAHEIARGLQYIHGEDVLHRDLKSANVLLTKHMEVKLCDFGFATIGSVTATQTGSTMGTLRWLAPELLSTRPKYSTKSDIYALGMVMWEMAANCTKPFKDHSNDVMIAVLVEQGSREELPEDTPPEYRKWVERCWSHDRNLRPEASEVILVRAKPEFEYRENDIAPISATDAGDDTLVATLNALNGLMDKSKTDRTNRKGYGATGPKASASSNDTIVGRIPSIRKAAAGNTPGSTTPSSTRRSNESTASNTLINNNPPNSTRRSNDSNAGNTPNSKPPTSTPRNGVLINNNAQGTTPPMTNPRSSSLQNGNPLNGSPLRATPDKTLSNLEARARRPLSRDLLSLDVGTLTRMIEQRDKALSNVVDRYHKAAAGGDTEAQTILGWAYDNGRGVTQNGATAALWYRRAADSGSVEAQVNLGSLYLSGRGVAQSDAEAATWYRRAARSGSTTAQINLAWMYESGLGVKQDYAEAVAWYRKAADKGESAAQQRLGEMYSKGIGVTQSDSEAAYWFRQAAGQRK